MAAKPVKTNAMRLLERLGVPYTGHEYDKSDGAIDGMAVAAKTGRDPQSVYKTLVSRGASGRVLVYCIPVCDELDLKRAARAAGEKSVDMLPLAQVTAATGYVRGGVSPLGMKKQYPTYIDEKALQQKTIFVSGGQVGCQIEVEPEALLRAVDAAWMQG